MPSTDPRTVARIRAAVLSLFAPPGADVDLAWRAVDSASATEWELFFRAERCAVAMQEQLRHPSHASLNRTLPPSMRDALARHAVDESRMALSGLAQLHLLASAAQRHGWRIIVLKGGVTIAEGRAISVSDIDILVDLSLQHAVDSWLETAGFRAADSGPSAHHLAPRSSENAIPIEVHATLSQYDDLRGARARAVPIRTMPALLRFAPADHVWHALVHAVAQHPERRGRLRDLIMLSQAIAECDTTELATVRGRIDTHDDRKILHATFAMADAMRRRLPVDDPFAIVSLRKYVFLNHYDGKPTNARSRVLRFICHDVSLWRALRDDLRLPHDGHSASTGLNWLNRHAPWMMKPVRQLLRVVRMGMVARLAAANAAETRRLLHARPSGG